VDADISRLLGGIPWALPAAFAAVLVAAALARPIARRTGQTPLAAWMVLASVGAIVGMTLTPSPDYPFQRSCDVDVLGPTFRDLFTLNDRSLNVLLFIPLGIAAIAIRTRNRLAWLLLAAAVAPLIEVTQLLAVPLRRTCQAIDVIDNELGLVIGLAAAGIAWWAWRRIRSRRDPE
jgi:hypothetical protein